MCSALYDLHYRGIYAMPHCSTPKDVRLLELQEIPSDRTEYYQISDKRDYFSFYFALDLNVLKRLRYFASWIFNSRHDYSIHDCNGTKTMLTHFNISRLQLTILYVFIYYKTVSEKGIIHHSTTILCRTLLNYSASLYSILKWVNGENK